MLLVVSWLWACCPQLITLHRHILANLRRTVPFWVGICMSRFVTSTGARALSLISPPFPLSPAFALPKTSDPSASTQRLITIGSKRVRCSLSTQAGSVNTSNVRIVTYNVLSSHLAEPSYFRECKVEDLDASTRLRRVKAKLETEMAKGSVLCLQEIGIQWAGDLHVFFMEKGYTFVLTTYGSRQSNYMGVALAWPSDKYEALTVDITRLSETRAWGKKRPEPTSNASQSEEQSRKSRLRTPLLQPIKSLLAMVTNAGIKSAPNEKPSESAEVERYREWALAERRLNRTLFARLRPKATGTGKQNAGAFCVGTYHMPCMFLVPPVMTIHASMAIQHFAQLAGSDPLVFAGDFNFTPQSECYKLVTEGDLSTDSPGFPDRPEWEKDWSAATGVRMFSAYKEVEGHEPDFTNHAKVADMPLFVETLDYLFHTAGITPTKVLPLMHRDDVKGTLPMETEPSDHLMLAAEYKF